MELEQQLRNCADENVCLSDESAFLEFSLHYSKAKLRAFFTRLKIVEPVPFSSAFVDVSIANRVQFSLI